MRDIVRWRERQNPKEYRKQSDPDVFFREIAKFLLEVACVHPKSYEMPKNKVGLIITKYQGNVVDWGFFYRSGSMSKHPCVASQ